MRISDWSSDVCSSDLLVEPGMVGQRRITLSGEPCCNLVDPRARQAVDDAGVAGVLREEGLELRPRTLFRHDAIADVGPVESGDEDPTARKFQTHDDVAPRRTEERRVGQEWVRPGRSRWS